MKIPIIFEDEWLIVIDKPSGVVVNRSENARNKTIQDWALLRQGFGGQAEEKNKSEFINRAGIVHRLDKDTSGVLLIAKNESVFDNLQEQFKVRTVKKGYTALVHGIIKAKDFTINAPVGRLPNNRRKFGVIVEGRPSETKVKVREYYRDNFNNKFTLISALPYTGRTHQIRIHLKHSGFSIIADPLYSGRKVYREDIKICPRLFLHAQFLEFRHPQTDKIIKFESPLPDELQKVLNQLHKFND